MMRFLAEREHKSNTLERMKNYIFTSHVFNLKFKREVPGVLGRTSQDFCLAGWWKFRTKLPMWRESMKLPDYRRRKRIGPKTDLTVFLAYGTKEAED